MIKLSHMKADYKQLLREPIMIFLLGLPMVLIIVGKIAVTHLPRIVYDYTQIDILDYYGYIVGMIFLLIAGMLGTVTGFMMLDDKDAKIYDLMSITPLGREGYLYNRLAMPIIIGCLYCIITCALYKDISINIGMLVIILTLISMQIIIIGMILFYVADDKVKGLTYAKGLNIVVLFALADLIHNSLIHYIAFLLPTYWVTKIILEPTLLHITMAIVTHIFWLVLICYRFYSDRL